MATTITATFADRRSVELAVEHLVQEYGIDRTDVFIQPAGDDNSVGTQPSGADAESSGEAIDTVDDAAPKLGCALLVSVDMNEDESDAVMTAFRDAGATDVATR